VPIVGGFPYALCHNVADDKVYCANYWGNTVSVIDGATNSVVATIAAGGYSRALCHNPLRNKVYCANYISADVTVIDGSADSVIATAAVGHGAYALYYNSLNDKVYCADWADESVTVIDGVTNGVINTVRVGMMPSALVWNPIQNRTYVANQGNSSISVLRDSGGAIEERVDSEMRRVNPGPTIVRGYLLLPEAVSDKRSAASAMLLDITGRCVMDLAPGENDVSRVAPGVYFVFRASGVEREATNIRKVVIQR
jgi:YVTN family beta-propeller protein